MTDRRLRPPAVPVRPPRPARCRSPQRFDGGVVDLSIGTPCDPPPPAVVAALSASDSERGYPPSIGTPELREPIGAGWPAASASTSPLAADRRRASAPRSSSAPLPQWLRLRTPDRDTVLYPAVAYPTYEMGAILAGCRPVAGAARRRRWRSTSPPSTPADAARALVLWVNSPATRPGALDDLGAAAAWGRAHDVPVFSDECYVEFTWDGPARTILEHGLDGVVAVHSLSKRSNLAGVRVGFYAGDAELVALPAGGAQARRDDGARSGAGGRGRRPRRRRPRRAPARRYRRRLELAAEALGGWAGIDIALPAGGFYLWFDAGDGWEFAERLARDGGALVSPGEFYGPGCASYVRVAVVQPDDRIELMAARLRAGGA